MTEQSNILKGNTLTICNFSFKMKKGLVSGVFKVLQTMFHIKVTFNNVTHHSMTLHGALGQYSHPGMSLQSEIK